MIKLPKLKIGLALILAVALLTSGLYFGSTFAQTTNPYEKDDLKITEIEKLYHKNVNDIFNSKLTLLKQGEKGSGTTEIPKGDECSQSNYSTFCLSMAVADEYSKYAEALNKRKTIIDISEGDTLLTLAATASVQKTEIETELVRSKKALDTALATYNDLLTTYRMHIKYEQLIKALTDYNKKLSEFRKEIEKLPAKFIDPTTASCT